MIGPKTTLSLQTVSQVTDGMGGFTDTWTTIKNITGVLTRSSIAYRASERVYADKRTVQAQYTFFCDYPTDVTVAEKDRFVLGSRIFEILYVYNPGNADHHLEVELEEIT